MCTTPPACTGGGQLRVHPAGVTGWSAGWARSGRRARRTGRGGYRAGNRARRTQESQSHCSQSARQWLHQPSQAHPKITVAAAHSATRDTARPGKGQVHQAAGREHGRASWKPWHLSKLCKSEQETAKGHSKKQRGGGRKGSYQAPTARKCACLLIPKAPILPDFKK